MKTLKKHSSKELQQLLLEAQADETSPERLIEIWKETTSAKVREKVVINPKLPISFIKTPKVMTLAAQAVLDNPSVDLLVLFESSEVFPPNLVEILKAIMKIKNEGWSINYAKEYTHLRLFPYLTKPFVKAVMAEKNSAESKINFINFYIEAGPTWRIERVLKDDIFSGKKKRKAFMQDLSVAFKEKLEESSRQDKSPADYFSQILNLCKVIKSL